MCTGLHRFVVVIITSFVAPSLQYVRIGLKNGSSSFGNDYEDNTVFAHRFANVPDDGKVEGYVWRWQHEQFPVNGCDYIPPLPYNELANGTNWFALVDNPNSECPDDMIKNVRNAGFYLILGYINGSSSAIDLSKNLRDSNFPIVSISGTYADTLRINAATYTKGQITANIETIDEDNWIIGVSVSVFLLVVGLHFMVCVVICWYRSQRRGRYHVRPVPTARDPLLQERYNQARMARQELIESILRQLQTLQAEHTRHPPLGEAGTIALPQRTYAELHRDTSSKETCAICVEEFEEKDVIRILPCNHFFHPACIDPWLTDHSSMCPLCKQPVRRNERGDNLPPLREEDSFASLSTSTESVSADEFGTPTASTPAIVSLMNTDDPSPPLHQVRGSSVNGDSSDSTTPLLHQQLERLSHHH